MKKKKVKKWGNPFFVCFSLSFALSLSLLSTPEKTLFHSLRSLPLKTHCAQHEKKTRRTKNKKKKHLSLLLMINHSSARVFRAQPRLEGVDARPRPARPGPVQLGLAQARAAAFEQEDVERRVDLHVVLGEVELLERVQGKRFVFRTPMRFVSLSERRRGFFVFFVLVFSLSLSFFTAPASVSSRRSSARPAASPAPPP